MAKKGLKHPHLIVLGHIWSNTVKCGLENEFWKNLKFGPILLIIATHENMKNQVRATLAPPVSA